MNRLKKLAYARLSKVADTPGELLNFLNTDCEYGYLYKDKKYTDDFSKYHTISPTDFSKQRLGVCWDYANYEYAYFKEYFKNIPCELYYIEMASLTAEPTHTWLSYQLNDKYYIIESSWFKNRGIHEYNSKKEMIDDYVMKFMKSNHTVQTKEKYAVLTYELPTKYNMSSIGFMDYVWSHGHIVLDNGLAELFIK